MRSQNAHAEAPSLDDVPNRYAEVPPLAEAYRQGWAAWHQGKSRPGRGAFGSGNEAKAWLEGYVDAGDISSQ